VAQEKKHILVLNRSFWPDTESTGQCLTDLCQELAARFEVTAIVGRSYFVTRNNFRPGSLYKKEIFKGIRIIRVRHTRFWKANLTGRIINWLTYSLLAFARSEEHTSELQSP
jgi:colanic acid biosynthesis glycosyl transferase WcaI